MGKPMGNWGKRWRRDGVFMRKMRLYTWTLHSYGGTKWGTIGNDSQTYGKKQRDIDQQSWGYNRNIAGDLFQPLDSWLKWWTIGHVLKHCRKHWKHGTKITIYHLKTICSWGKFETDQMGKHWERLAKVGGLAIFGWLTSEKKAGFASNRDDDKKLNVRRVETQDNWARDHHWRINIIVSVRRFYSQARHDHHYTIRIGWWRSTILWRFKTLKSGCCHQPETMVFSALDAAWARLLATFPCLDDPISMIKGT